MEAVVVSRSQVDHDVEQVVVGARQQEVPEGRRRVWRETRGSGISWSTPGGQLRCVRAPTAALLLLWTQEVLQAVGDPLHLLHLRVLHPTKMEDPSVGWGDLSHTHLVSDITLDLLSLCFDLRTLSGLPDRKRSRAASRRV